MSIHPLQEIEIDLELTLRGDLAKSVAEIAERRRQEPAELLADVIEAVFGDDIVDAVLDDEPLEPMSGFIM